MRPTDRHRRERSSRRTPCGCRASRSAAARSLQRSFCQLRIHQLFHPRLLHVLFRRDEREHGAAGDERAGVSGAGKMSAGATSPPRFEMRGIRKAFGATIALGGVDLSVASGEVCGLIGQNGAGKSTLMSILAGALKPDSGEMFIDGARYAPENPLEARRAGIAMIYQALSLAPHLSVMENILMGAEPMRFGLVDRSKMRAMATRALADLGHDDISPDVPVGSLSVAAQQLVEIARALAVGCRVLVLDEPTSSLGRADVERLFDLLARLKAQGHAIVYISH